MSPADTVGRRRGPARTDVDRARSGAPAAGEAVGDRFSTDEIFQRVVATADEEVGTSTRKLYLSGLAAGFAITLTFFVYGTLKAAFPNDTTGLLAALLYPLGFVYIIMGRYQLYTENTLTPVALVLTRVASVPSLFRVWAGVLAGNLTGALVGAFVHWMDVVQSVVREQDVFEAVVLEVEVGPAADTEIDLKVYRRRRP
ncbi:formate/nitrite transporter family protein [Haloarchaeobius sp. DFWS5]|uniref:formate/nitrite transporter family protein n=1 Tax=Haloarchaeobius sp. DFWS5 TaxID=3446114 RepID=UPI003EBCBBFE